MIQLENVRKAYQMGKIELPVLHGVDLTIDDGEMVAIMGPSGSGKSTLMNILGCLDIPTSGRYLLDGAVTTTITAHVPHQQMWFGVQTAPARQIRPSKPVRFDIDWVKVYAYQG